MKIALIAVALFMVHDAAGHKCSPACKDKPMDISFVMDSSSSVTASGFRHGMEFIVRLLDHFDIGQDMVRASLISYGGQMLDASSSDYQRGAVYEEYAIYFKDNVNNKALQDAFLEVPYKPGGYTNTSAGIGFALDQQLSTSRPAAKQVMVVITDGQSQDPDLTSLEARRARRSGVNVYAVGVGPEVNSLELKNIAGKSNHVRRASSYEKLGEELEDKLTNLICDDECRKIALDIMFVIDSSSSIAAIGGYAAFSHGLQFITSILEFLEIDSGLARVAAVQYAKGVRSREAIHFNDYTEKTSLQQAILNIQYIYRGSPDFNTQTETGRGIDFAVNNFMSNARPDAVKAIVVVTDGVSNYHDGHSKERTIMAANRARQAGATVFAVGVGSQTDSDELRQIADSQSQVFNAENYSKLDAIREDLTSLICWTADYYYLNQAYPNAGILTTK